VPSWWWISDASLSPPFTSRVSVWWAGGEDRFRRVLVKALGLSGPKRLPSTGAPNGAGLHRTPLWWEPATVLAALPPRAGFRRSFAAPRSRLEWLDPGRAHKLIARERPWPRAALSTSATDHDPRAQPLDRPNLAHRGRGRPRSQLFFARPSRVQRVERWSADRVDADCEWLCFEARPTEDSRARGRVELALEPCTSRCDRSRAGASPQPDRLEHLTSRPVATQAGEAYAAGAFAPIRTRRVNTTRRR
jgi:Zn-finger nucleic acid-binding protein